MMNGQVPKALPYRFDGVTSLAVLVGEAESLRACGFLIRSSASRLPLKRLLVSQHGVHWVRGVPVERDAGVTAVMGLELFLSGLRGRQCGSAGHPDQDVVNDIR